MSDLLTKLSNKYKCDKSERKHNYTVYYNTFFEKDRHRNFNILEFGFGEGRSVKMWLEYFTKAKLFVIDTMKSLPNDNKILEYVKIKRLEFVSADQIDLPSFSGIFNKNDFYIIIDDASHVAEDQQYTFGNIFQFVSSGGWYVIEDLKCKRNPSKRFPVNADLTLKVFENYNLNGRFSSAVLTEEQNIYLNALIESVKIYDKIAFIKKR